MDYLLVSEPRITDMYDYGPRTTTPWPDECFCQYVCNNGKPDKALHTMYRNKALLAARMLDEPTTEVDIDCSCNADSMAAFCAVGFMQQCMNLDYSSGVCRSVRPTTQSDDDHEEGSSPPFERQTCPELDKHVELDRRIFRALDRAEAVGDHDRTMTSAHLLGQEDGYQWTDHEDPHFKHLQSDPGFKHLR
jgi:hypothetical protein